MSESSPSRGALTFRCFDLETTGTDVETCEVVQAAVSSVCAWPRAQAEIERGLSRTGFDFASLETHSQLFAARDVPPESTQVHRITDRNPERFAFPVTVIPDDAPPFAACVQSMVSALTGPDVVSVSFNGCGYDIPIVARYLHAGHAVSDFRLTDWNTPNACVSRQQIEQRLRARHVDVMRLWLRAKTAALPMEWEVSPSWQRLTADMFAGSLTAAHGFWLGAGFDSAHDAANDCRATLAVLDAMLRSGFVDVEQAIRWSNEPLPGDVDFDGKFKWQGDQVVIGFGKHSGTPLERLPASYLRWMLDSDFPASTKHVARRFLAGEYPARAYEAE